MQLWKMQKCEIHILSGFDGSPFASGSHAVLGTVIVQTSDKLTASQQKT